MFVRGNNDGFNKLANGQWVAAEIEELVRDVTTLTPKSIVVRIKKKFGVAISYYIAWNAKTICMEKIVGSYDEGYKQFPALCLEILHTNPGSIVRTWREDTSLQWTEACVAFKASLDGQVDKQIFLDKLVDVDPSAKAWLDQEPYDHWCRSHFDFTSKCEHITNNFSESFNWWIMKIRDKPLQKTIERLNLMIMKLMFERRTKAATWDQDGLVSRAVAHLEKVMQRYGEYDVVGGNLDECISIRSSDSRWTVNFKAHTCQCNEWQVTGLPCVHAASILVPMRNDTYSGVIHPVSYYSHWEKPPTHVEPPLLVRGSGRPRKVRIKGTDEGGGSQKRCGKCGGYGHNKKTCEGLPVADYTSAWGKEKRQIYGMRNRKGDDPTSPTQGRGRGNGGIATPVSPRQCRGRGNGRIATPTPPRQGRGWGNGGITAPAPPRQGRTKHASSNQGIGRGRSRSTHTELSQGRGGGGSRTTHASSTTTSVAPNHQRFVEKWLSNSVPNQASQIVPIQASQIDPAQASQTVPAQASQAVPSNIPTVVSQALTNPYKRTFRPPRQV
ncbi:hypothetical protein GIB67_014109 [Kingdonia uniflora]|uniref:SWIM-type domain-containing protein n=1 Tax=Kingdonia uniflora TaxID=39325 RepID=A0A7J7KXG0_9MAGN|nr:hypothetical protein GIB67_014109 [Kingdonia uniflora]